MKHGRIHVIIIALSILAPCCSQVKKDGNIPLDHSILIAASPSVVTYRHVIIPDSVRRTGLLTRGISMKMQQKPLPLSMNFHDNIIQSRRLYDLGRFDEAANILETPYREEPDNPFIAEALARALYRFEQKRSYDVYLRLVALLDRKEGDAAAFGFTPEYKRRYDDTMTRELDELWRDLGKTGRQETVIDFWFTEAYWKTGCLHLDHGEYLAGAYDISRMLCIGVNDNPLLLEQALGYLTESYYMLGKFHLARTFAAETLRQFPDNTYIARFLPEIEKNIAAGYR